jgi:hypothetical protein
MKLNDHFWRRKSLSACSAPPKKAHLQIGALEWKVYGCLHLIIGN